MPAANGIWSLEEAKQSHFFDEPLATAIVEHFGLKPPESTADLGCGKGYYVKHLIAAGWSSVHGYEGTPDISSISGIRIDEVDLTTALIPIHNYEFVICLEVGEHLPREKEKILLDNIYRFSRGSVVLSWAIPGQAGVGHINCRTNEYVIEQMIKYGFAFQMDTAVKLRKASTLPWFANTIMWFDRV